MKRDEFSAQSPGALLEVPGGVAFLPDRLPPDIELSWELLGALDKATRALSMLNGQASLIQNLTLVIRPLLVREAVQSARLEGTHTHVAGVLFQESALSPADPEEVKNNLEVLNYLSASFSGERWLADGRPFGLHLIHSLHVALLKGTRGENRHPGQFRPDQVVIGAPGDTPEDARFVPPPPEHVQPAIEDVLHYIGESDPHPPLIAAAVTHYQFETIHPFQDGNGRLGRLLIPLQLIQSNAITQPLIYLSPYFEARRDEYLARLKNVSTKGDWESWVLFFLDAVTVQAEDARSRVQRILALHDRYRQLAATKRSKGPSYAVDAVMEKVIVTARQVAQYANCDFTTAQSALAALEELGIVVKVEPSYPQRWIAQELMREVYEQ